MVSYQAGLSTGMSLIGWSFNGTVSYQAGLSTGRSLIRLVFQRDGLSSGWSFAEVVSYHGDLSTEYRVFPQRFPL